MSEPRSYTAVEAKIIGALRARPNDTEVDELAVAVGEPHPHVAGTLRVLADLGIVGLREETVTEYQLGPKGKGLPSGMLPERVVMVALAARGRIALRDLEAATGLAQKDAGRALKPLESKGFAVREGGDLVARGVLAQGQTPELMEHERLVAHLAGGGSGMRPALSAVGIDVDRALAELEGRGGIITTKERRRWWARLTEQGRALREEDMVVRQTVTALDTGLLKDGSWRGVDFRPYDVGLASRRLFPGKEHPLRRVLGDTRRVFLDLGFTEVTSPLVESAFWDFDALFQPQDHPAREMQDTFYVQRPERASLPSAEVVRRVQRTHEDGGDTGSIGWDYRWNRAIAERVVLRTHTTAGTIRALADNPRPPRKIFLVGTVFRREAVDYKHLPLFYQVDGIIIDEHASFASLLGTLDAFYRKMGFERFEFRPGFFPYTEPSVEVFVWHEAKKDWVEMGGAGVFREEVTKPFGCSVPVLAWGLGLERLAMFRYGLESIRDLYLSDLAWLREVPLCR
ncbi:MAG: phenylalanine--tRNA ligase subunit alpha [Candidatus Eisenbacteria bacterium]|jgi:phenylalanyl-tRNA synthetase alpha chain|nr:phenylalanine--tRNA ligase subunit alpha [Candidatus Eisenbacteria bacterium]